MGRLRAGGRSKGGLNRRLSSLKRRPLSADEKEGYAQTARQMRRAHELHPDVVWSRMMYEGACAIEDLLEKIDDNT